ncbi:uncharacterized protein LOC134788256 [Penaeus indicus]|uniref:uncharacterized protein LOC134788256 n=1 Tax=Penaeus indicus TaxID=29960 RepID=UPI00300C9FAA
MKGVSLAILCCVLAAASANNGRGSTRFFGTGGHQSPSQCRYWCRNPENQVYCCENTFEPEGPVGTKPLNCPIVRPTCPFNVRGLRPITCSNDYRCGGVDKCCFDRCLQEHVCKPPSFFG